MNVMPRPMLIKLLDVRMKIDEFEDSIVDELIAVRTQIQDKEYGAAAEHVTFLIELLMDEGASGDETEDD